MDKIQTIPAGLEKYLGSGEMILPSQETIRNELQKIPEGKLTTIPAIRESIAKQFGVTTACPKTSLKMLRNMMAEKNSGVYKVLNGKGELIASDLELQAELLKLDGFDIDQSKSKPKVKDFKKHLFN
jgi:alkylated DNA nucleotide flippase Atl1